MSIDEFYRRKTLPVHFVLQIPEELNIIKICNTTDVPSKPFFLLNISFQRMCMVTKVSIDPSKGISFLRHQLHKDLLKIIHIRYYLSSFSQMMSMNTLQSLIDHNSCRT